VAGRPPVARWVASWSRLFGLLSHRGDLRLGLGLGEPALDRVEVGVRLDDAVVHLVVELVDLPLDVFEVSGLRGRRDLGAGDVRLRAHLRDQVRRAVEQRPRAYRLVRLAAACRLGAAREHGVRAVLELVQLRDVGLRGRDAVILEMPEVVDLRTSPKKRDSPDQERCENDAADHGAKLKHTPADRQGQPTTGASSLHALPCESTSSTYDKNAA
jgi:hypothetical protein